MVLSSDAEKAFNQVEWPYVFAVLKKIETGDFYISWIKLLYNNLYAKIRTNQTHFMDITQCIPLLKYIFTQEISFFSYLNHKHRLHQFCP